MQNQRPRRIVNWDTTPVTHGPKPVVKLKLDDRNSSSPDAGYRDSSKLHQSQGKARKQLRTETAIPQQKKALTDWF